MSNSITDTNSEDIVLCVVTTEDDSAHREGSWVLLGTS
ncbi:MAG: hypothetical protein J07HX64_01318 [halophilic archaeon J07HX64]|nr:MAG: hypothetical protein J07HX64_01318 [halophilic archaeon J07HX64]